MDNNIVKQDSITFSSKRITVFDNLVNNENDFTELLCNMTRFKEFNNILSDFICIKNNNIYIDTQYRTKKHGKPDIVISYDNGIEFIEVKVGNSKLTKNQPEGYIKALLKRPEETKKLFFLIPKNYYYLKELKYRIKNVKNSKIKIEPIYWEDFFEHCKKNMIFKKNKVFFEYYNLLKSWFGYETVVFNKGEKNIMNKDLEKMSKVGSWLESIYSLLTQKGLKPERSDSLDDIGIYIADKKGVYYGWIGIWFPLWKETGDIFIYTISDKNNKKYYNNLKNKKECKTYKLRKDDGPDVETFAYICFDDYIFSKNEDSSIISDKLLEIFKNIKSTK